MAAEYTQADRPLRIETSLGTDVLLITGLTGTEAVSRPFRFELELLSTRADIAPGDVLRQPVTVKLPLANGGERAINGVFSQFSRTGKREGLATYRAEMVPRAWMLTRRANARIFQQKSILEIVEQIFSEGNVSDYEIRSVSRPARDYVVQYNETDLTFLSRWLEREGIFYWFEHTDGKHLLVLADANGRFKACPEIATARLTEEPVVNEDVVTSVKRQHTVQVGKVTLRDYNFEMPSNTLEGTLSGDGFQEIYQYPGGFEKAADGDRYARYRLEAEEARLLEVHGSGNCRHFVSGHKFTLSGHFDGAMNVEYVITSVRHTIRTGAFRAGGGGELDYWNEFTCIPVSVPYRPLRLTPRPLLHGPQTAVVVGPAGEEIWTDKYGRVKVQFHWDREGKKDENSSCWVRVSSPWAGKQWGAVHIPRIGQEVVVDFLEGDPDRPIITGSVYNAEQMPPYALPDNKTQSGVKSRSSKKGTGENFNEIRFEDLKGSELLTIHAEKDREIVVENDDRESVGNDQSVSVGNDRTKSVGRDETTSVAGSRSESVSKDETITISGNRTESVGGEETVTVDKDRRITIGKKESVSVGDKRTTEIGKDDNLQVGKKLTINAGDEITLKTGSAQIQMKKDGTIVIKGKDIKIQASGKIAAKASSDITMKGSQIKQN